MGIRKRTKGKKQRNITILACMGTYTNMHMFCVWQLGVVFLLLLVLIIAGVHKSKKNIETVPAVHNLFKTSHSNNIMFNKCGK